MSLPEFHFYEVPDWVTNFRWLAVVGARSFANPCWRTIADNLVESASNQIEIADREFGIVSGGAAGIDTLGEQFADKWWYRKCILIPRHKRWAPGGFEARNELIGQVCDWMIAIRCEHTKSWGTGHAAEYAEGLGKQVARYVIHENPDCPGCATDESWKVQCVA